MRIWDCDPRLLSNRHLLGEHREVHSLIRGGWEAHPEWLRFAEHPALLILRHDALAVAMEERFSSGPHKTPVLSEEWMSPAEQITLAQWERGKISWAQLCRGVIWPATLLEHGTPWERDDVPFEWYQQHLHDWSHQLVREFHGGALPVGSFYGSRQAA